MFSGKTALPIELGKGRRTGGLIGAVEPVMLAASVIEAAAAAEPATMLG